MTTIDQYADIIDVRDIIARVEELEDSAEVIADAGDAEELAELRAFLFDLEGMGGDEQWRGVWYPVTLIRDSHFRDYAQELAEEIGAIPDDARWPCTCIDWDHAARELQNDYSSVEFRGVTYWTR